TDGPRHPRQHRPAVYVLHLTRVWSLPMLRMLAIFGLDISVNRVLEFMNRGGIGYAVLFGMLFLCGLGLPVPEDIPLIVSGILIGNGNMHVAIAAPLAWAGIIGGDCVLYMLGHRYGLNITR